MKAIRVSAVLLVLVPILSSAKIPLPTADAAGPSTVSSGINLAVRVSQLPIVFEVNAGQIDRQVRFLARGSGYTLFLTGTEAILAPHPHPTATLHTGHGTAVIIRYVGANSQPLVTGRQRLPGRVNYFIGNNPKSWHTNIPTYARVQYRNVYPGIDLAYYGRSSHLEYDWIVRPGADPGKIALRVQGTGIHGVHLDAGGNLALGSQGNDILQLRPTVFQWLGSRKVHVAAHYSVSSGPTIRFALGLYDRRRPLVIDPTLIYSTYLGGRDEDAAAAIAVGKDGAAYVTGDTASLDFPVLHPAQPRLRSDATCVDITRTVPLPCTDAFVSKVNPSGTALIYSTFLGGTRDDAGQAIAVDRLGNAYITGNTLSPDFPTTQPVQLHFGGGSVLGDAFVTKLNQTGSALDYSTYLGGGGEDDGSAIAVEHGAAFITGRTNSSNFPVRQALQPHLGGGTCSYQFDARASVPCYDAFVVKLDASGKSLQYSTYLGGKGTDFGWGIAARAGRAYVAGQTSSPGFPAARALQPTLSGGSCSAGRVPDSCTDAFVTVLSATGKTFVYSTYLGGSGSDIGDDIAVSGNGEAVIVGDTESSNFPLAHARQPKFIGSPDMAFVVRLRADGRSLVYSTYLGGSGSDEAYGVAVNTAGDVYVTGRTSSPNFPIKRALQRHIPGTESAQNAFISKLDATGQQLIYSTYLGGSDHDLGGHIAVDRAGNAYVAGFATSTDFRTVHAIQPVLAGGTFDAFIAKIGDG